MRIVVPANAQSEHETTYGVGVFDFPKLENIIFFVINVLVYLGWAGVFIAIGYIFFKLIYKLMSPDSEDAAKEFFGALQKAVLVIVLGLLLVNVRFIVNVVANLLGFGDWFFLDFPF